MSRQTNPPIKGHELIAEGHRTAAYDRLENRVWAWGCRCGARPDPYYGVNATKRWHRAHKAEIRGEAS